MGLIREPLRLWRQGSASLYHRAAWPTRPAPQGFDPLGRSDDDYTEVTEGTEEGIGPAGFLSSSVPSVLSVASVVKRIAALMQCVPAWVCAAALVLASAPSARPDIRVFIEPDTVRVAEPLTLTLENDTPGVTWPDWADALPGWEVVPQQVTDQNATLTLRSWLPGDLAIPAIIATTPGGVTFTSEPQTVTVTSVLPEDADVADAGTLREAAGALPVSDAGLSWPAKLGIGIGGALLLAGGYLLLRKTGASRHDPEADIDALVAAAAEQGDPALASAALRQSVELHFATTASRCTTDELQSDEQLARRLGKPLHTRLTGLLQRIDNARYAGVVTTADAGSTAGEARTVIQDLRATAKRAEAGKGGA